ncbi:hypothetical protein EDC04DRAFT_2653917 [Pisolithus marmoratus]|nr:hypothetical protein EDC04DRAFT_2653917 [Pisolithus marmoratus]
MVWAYLRDLFTRAPSRGKSAPPSSSPMHAVVVNPKSYTLDGALGPGQVRSGPEPSVLVPTSSQCDEPYSAMPPQSPPGFDVDTAVEYPLSAVKGTCTQAPSTSASCFEFPQGLEHPLTTPYMGSVAGDATWGPIQGRVAPAQIPEKAVDSGHKANSNAPCRKHAILCDRCLGMKCLHLSEDGTLCSKDITCASISEHFAGHGVKKKSRAAPILCRWAGCFKLQKRHNFVPEKRRTKGFADPERESITSDLPLAHCP